MAGVRAEGQETRFLWYWLLILHNTGKSTNTGLKKPGRVRISVVPDASKESILPFIKSNIETGSEIITDGWASYACLSNEGYMHTVHVKRTKKADELILPHVHLIVSLLKRRLLGTHQGAVSDKHMQAYLEEYAFRFNRRAAAKRGLLFYRLLEGAVASPPVTYNDLVNPTRDA